MLFRSSKRPIVKIEDIKGLKIRTMQNPICIDMFNTLGANATPLPMPEVFTALEQKTVDGQENPARTIEASKIYEVQKYMTLTRHMYNPMALMMSKKTWDKSKPADQKIVAEALTRATMKSIDEAKALDEQSMKAMEKKGIKVFRYSEAQLVPIAKAVAASWPKLEGKMTKELISEFRKNLAPK